MICLFPKRLITKDDNIPIEYFILLIKNFNYERNKIMFMNSKRQKESVQITPYRKDTSEHTKNIITSIDDIIDDVNTYDDVYEKISDYSQKNSVNRLETQTVTDLLDMVYESKLALIKDLLFSGTYLLAGSPKVGKSFLVAQIAYHIANGLPLWGYDVNQGTVLYMALEDNFERLQQRITRMFGVDDVDNLHCCISCNPLSDGLEQQLEIFINEHKDTKLIIIDTLQRVLDVNCDYSYSKDYDVITKLKKFADRYGICMLIVHHTRKQKSEDMFDMISGTNGLLGASDGGFILRKENRMSNTATLDVSGRDQQDQKLVLMRNTNSLVWELVRVETEASEEHCGAFEPLLEAIAKNVNYVNRKWQGTAEELKLLIGEDLTPNLLSRKLNANSKRLLEQYHIELKRKINQGSKIIYLEYKQ